MNVTARWILCTIVDEGASVRILSSIAWKDIGSPLLMPATDQILGGKTVCIDVMVLQGPLDFNMLLGRDYVYAMKSIVSTLFRVMHFPMMGIL